MKKLNTLILTLTITANVFAQTDTLKVKYLDQVVVTGQYKPQSVKNSVYQVRIISNESIIATGAASVQQVLVTQLGFRFSQDNTLGVSDVQLQGMSGRNVKVLLDGVPMTDRGDTRESLNQVDINTIERIEIIEGPMSVSYGSDALAGVINVITKKNVKHPFALSAKVQEETVGSEYYPFHYKGQHSQHLDLHWRKDLWNFSAGVTHQEFDGFGGVAYGRDKTWLPKEQWLGHFKTGYTRDRFNIYYRLDGLQEWIKDRGPINTNTYKAIDKKYFTNRFMHQLQGNWSFNNSIQWSSVLAFTNYKRETITTRHDFEKDIDEKTTGEGEQDISKFNSLVFRNTLFYKVNSKISLQPGIDINREEASGARIAGTPVITDYALFVSAEYKPLEKVNIRPGLRFIKNSVYDAPPVIPSINAKFSLSGKADLRLAYAYGFRSPALRELYFEFRDANHQIVGNPDLKAEHSNSFSGAFNYAFLQSSKASLATTATVFYNEFRNLINYAQTAGDPNVYMYVNIDKFKTTGISWETNLNLSRLSATLGLSYLGRYNQFADDPEYKNDELSSFSWSPEFNSNLLYSFNKIGATIGVFYKFTGIRPGYQLFFNSTTGTDELHRTKIESFHWADLSFSKKLFSYFTATAGIKNIFDVTSLSNTSTTAGSVHSSGGPVTMGYGRSYYIGLAYQFNKSKN